MIDVLTELVKFLADDSVKGWARVATFAIFMASILMAFWLYTVRQDQKEAKDDMQVIKKTLTTNNSGSHIKDQLDRLEANQNEFVKTMEQMNARIEAVERRRWFR